MKLFTNSLCIRRAHEFAIHPGPRSRSPRPIIARVKSWFNLVTLKPPKPEARNPKIRTKSEVRNPKRNRVSDRAHAREDHSDFGFSSDFGLRISDLTPHVVVVSSGPVMTRTWVIASGVSSFTISMKFIFTMR